MISRKMKLLHILDYICLESELIKNVIEINMKNKTNLFFKKISFYLSIFKKDKT